MEDVREAKLGRVFKGKTFVDEQPRVGRLLSPKRTN